MSTGEENDANYAIYRFIDPISNFRLRVKLERLSTNALLPSLQRLKIEEDLVRLLDHTGKPAETSRVSKTDRAQAMDETKRSEYEEVVIGWQQKLFSRREWEKYGKAISPTSDPLDKKYYDDIQRMTAQGRTPGRIFTYIEGDIGIAVKEFEYFMTDSPNEEPSELAIGMTTIRKRRGPQSRVGLNVGHHLPKNNLVVQKITDEDRRLNHFANISYQTMYIMVDLTDINPATTAQLTVGPAQLTEQILCIIRVYSNGTLIMEPDFNNGKMPYIVETDSQNNAAFHYYLEHASAPIQIDDLMKEKKLFREVSLRQQMYLSQLVGNDFATPPPSVLKLTIFGEIVSGKNFEYDDLYVFYCLDLPENWYADPSMIFSGYTHTATGVDYGEEEGTVHYCHPFEFEIFYNPPPGAADQELPQMPKIFFQVASQDGWGRHRTEGYTYIDVPSEPGFYNENLHCWRPRGDSIFNELRRFFIGGSHELEDINYVAIPKQFEGEKHKTPLSRFGFRTVSTGTLQVRLHVVFQSQTIAVEHRKRHGAYEAHRFGFDTFMSNINAVIDAFQQAKKRALEVRESTFRLINTDQSSYA